MPPTLSLSTAAVPFDSFLDVVVAPEQLVQRLGEGEETSQRQQPKGTDTPGKYWLKRSDFRTLGGCVLRRSVHVTTLQMTAGPVSAFPVLTPCPESTHRCHSHRQACRTGFPTLRHLFQRGKLSCSPLSITCSCLCVFNGRTAGGPHQRGRSGEGVSSRLSHSFPHKQRRFENGKLLLFNLLEVMNILSRSRQKS